MEKHLINNLLQDAIALQRSNKYKEAEIKYIRILEKHPNIFEANFLLGFLYKQTRKYKSAEIYLKKATILNRNHPESRYNLGFVFEKLNFG